MLLNQDSSRELKFLAAFLLISVFIFIAGLIISIYFIFINPMNKEKTTATITNITNNTTTVKYEVNGRLYEKRYSSYSSTYYVGKKIKIYYNKRKPIDSSIASFRFLSLIAPGIGIIFIGVSGILCIVFYKKEYSA